MTNITQGSLTMVGLHTSTPTVFWNGAEVKGLTGIKVNNINGVQLVVLTLAEDPVLAEMQQAGIVIRRAA